MQKYKIRAVDFLIKFFKTNFEITTELFENKPAICQVPET